MPKEGLEEPSKDRIKAEEGEERLKTAREIALEAVGPFHISSKEAGLEEKKIKPEDAREIPWEAPELPPSVLAKKEALQEEKAFKEQEADPSKYFEDVQARGVFRKLSEGAKEFLGNLYERSKMSVVDRLKIWYSAKLEDWYAGRTDKLAKKFEEKNEATKDLKEKRDELKERLVNLRETFGGRIDPKLAIKAKKEKRWYDSKIKKEESGAKKIESKLNLKDAKKSAYEIKRKKAVEKLSSRIEEKVKPLRADVEKLTARNKQLDLEIASFRSQKEEFSAVLQDLEKDVEGAMFSFEKKLYKKLIKEAKSTLKKVDEIIENRSADVDKTNRRVLAAEEKINSWQNKRDALSVFSPREKAEKSREAPELATKKPKESGKLEEERDKIETAETSGEKMKVGDYIKEWNKHLGSRFPINKDEFKKHMEKVGLKDKIIEDVGFEDELDVGSLDGFLEGYYKAKKGSGRKEKKEFGGLLGLFRKLLIGVK